VVPSTATTDPALLPEFSFFFSFYTHGGVTALASLVPIGVINYYMVPITLGGIN
jgi:hypothetical protein